MIDLRCRSGKDCVARTKDGAAIITGNTMCHGCIGAIQKCLDELPHLAAALNALKGNWGSISYEARVTGSKEPPTPLHIGVVDQIDRIWDTIDRAGGYRIVDLVTQPAEEWLIGGRRVVRDGVHRALEIRWVHAKASDMAGLSKTWQRRAAACPECGLPTLGQWLGEDLILCSNEECLSSFTKTAYEHICAEQSRNEKGKKKSA